MLGSCRQLGMAVGPIPWDVIDLYATRHGLDEENSWVFRKVIAEMDRVYLEWMSEEAKSKTPPGK